MQGKEDAPQDLLGGSQSQEDTDMDGIRDLLKQSGYSSVRAPLLWGEFKPWHLSWSVLERPEVVSEGIRWAWRNR